MVTRDSGPSWRGLGGPFASAAAGGGATPRAIRGRARNGSACARSGVRERLDPRQRIPSTFDVKVFRRVSPRGTRFDTSAKPFASTFDDPASPLAAEAASPAVPAGSAVSVPRCRLGLGIEVVVGRGRLAAPRRQEAPPQQGQPRGQAHGRGERPGIAGGVAAAQEHSRLDADALEPQRGVADLEGRARRSQRSRADPDEARRRSATGCGPEVPGVTTRCSVTRWPAMSQLAPSVTAQRSGPAASRAAGTRPISPSSHRSLPRPEESGWL